MDPIIRLAPPEHDDLRELFSNMADGDRAEFRRTGFAWGDPNLPWTDTTLETGRTGKGTIGYDGYGWHSVRYPPTGGILELDKIAALAWQTPYDFISYFPRHAEENNPFVEALPRFTFPKPPRRTRKKHSRA